MAFIKTISRSGKKGKAGRPKIKLEDGCKIHDGWTKNKHCYSMFGKPQERCVKCGEENPMVTRWRKSIIKGEYEDHPYVKAGYWSLAEYKKEMKR